jgi:DNA polymerase elongation subunit (family B)
MATPNTLKTKRRRLFFDIETSPNIGLFWEAGYKKNIDYSNIIQERAIICICYKWEEEKEVYSLQWDSKQNDKAMLQKFIEVANLANEMVGHNGDKFDLAWIRTRCLFHKIEMFPNYVTIDTLKIARSKFRFNSNRLNLLEQVFNALKNHIPPKTHYGVIFGHYKGSCPECGSDDIIIKDRRALASGIIKLIFRCKTCGKHHNKTDK